MSCTKPKKKQNQKFGDDTDSVNSAEDIGDALILSVNSTVESWILVLVHLSIHLQARNCSKIQIWKFWKGVSC